jgi:DnaJ-class molecular chaperone
MGDGVHDAEPDEAPGAPSQGAADRCPECDGTGRVDGRECPACEGTGNVMRGLGGG